MIKEIQERFHEGIVKECAKRYGFSFEEMTFRGGFESFVYTCVNPSGRYIMKITHSLKRDIRHLCSEAEFVTYLHANDMPVSPVIPSSCGKSVERIDSGDGSFYAICYAEAPGTSPTDEQWNAALFRQWGRILGGMHRLTKQFRPASAAFCRLHWHENERLKLAKYIPSDQEGVLERGKELLASLNTLMRSPDSYGLVHNDFHQGNFFVSDGQITLFDFDDMEYSWFASDIAIVLYYAIYWRSLRRQMEPEGARAFFDAFMEGYGMENNIPGRWIEQIADFLMLRQLLLYAALHEAYDLSRLTSQQEYILQRMRREIEEKKNLLTL